jgi:pyruvate carboxylase subunit B
MLPIAAKLDRVGFYSLEVWGGATFDSALRYLNEDPWQRLRLLRERIVHTPLQMLLRGQNLVGYRHYADDVVKKFIRLAHKNGISIFRIFDALNDWRNLEVPIKAAKDVGAVVQGTISYTVSPVHTVERFVEFAKKLEEIGADVIYIKDMAGLISPTAAEALIRALKKELRVPVGLHTHCTSGMGYFACYKACEAGADIVDAAFSPFAGGTSQPPLEPLVAALKGTPYDPGLDLSLILDITSYFLKLREKYQGLISPVAERPDVEVLLHQIPGGMITNLYSQLEHQRAVERYAEVLAEVPKVREDLGYPPLVTPTSQIVGTQAVLNVLLGERYKEVTQEVRDYCRGLYGATPAPIAPELRKKILAGEEPINCRPADLLAPELPRAEEEVAKLLSSPTEEDVITYVLFPEIAAKFFRGEIEPEPIPSPQAVRSSAWTPEEFIVTVDGEDYVVRIRPNGSRAPAEERRAEEPSPEPPPGAVTSPVGGMVLRLNVKVGDRVEKGQVLMVMEAMKMQVPVTSPYDGEVKEIFAYESELVEAGDLLVVIQ